MGTLSALQTGQQLQKHSYNNCKHEQIQISVHHELHFGLSEEYLCCRRTDPCLRSLFKMPYEKSHSSRNGI